MANSLGHGIASKNSSRRSLATESTHPPFRNSGKNGNTARLPHCRHRPPATLPATKSAIAHTCSPLICCRQASLAAPSKIKITANRNPVMPPATIPAKTATSPAMPPACHHSSISATPTPDAHLPPTIPATKSAISATTPAIAHTVPHIAECSHTPATQNQNTGKSGNTSGNNSGNISGKLPTLNTHPTRHPCPIPTCAIACQLPAGHRPLARFCVGPQADFRRGFNCRPHWRFFRLGWHDTITGVAPPQA